MGDELGNNATYIWSIVSFRVFSTVYTKFHIDREVQFLELLYEFGVKI